ncbi:MAG: hypothetical protein NT085_04680 [candidate division SR1 bacterium]|nr:hypothetical protein [candidate division SR1 bacterium]
MAEIDVQTISEKTIFGLRITAATKTIIFLILLFFIPFFLGGPQLLVGSIVNLLLIFIAVKYRNYYAIIPMLMLPSIATSLRGLIFGPFSIFLVYMIPAIWLGNFLLIYTIQHIKNQRLSISIGGILKTIFLFAIAYILIKLGILPTIFFKAMGIFQLVTVMIAGVCYVGWSKLCTIKR